MKKYVPLLIVLLIAGLAWELVSRIIPSLIFFAGSPSSIAYELGAMIRHENFHEHFVITGTEAFSGLLIGSISGSITGLALWYFRAASRIFSPILLGIGSVPFLVFAPLMIIWFGVGIELKIALAAFTTFFVAFSQSSRGARSVAKEHVEVLQAMGATPGKIFWKAIVPGSLGWVLGSMRLNVGFCLLGAFVGEFIAAEKGLGYLVLRASSLYNMPRALAATVGIVVLAVAFDRCANFIEQRRNYIAQILSVPHVMQSGHSLFKHSV